jgi:hypothetical protein
VGVLYGRAWPPECGELSPPGGRRGLPRAGGALPGEYGYEREEATFRISESLKIHVPLHPHHTRQASPSWR